MQRKDNTKLFTDKAEAYRKFRPTYAAAYLDYLADVCRLDSASTVADIGAGTGILTGQLLARQWKVIAVEPNDGMRAAALEQLGQSPALILLSGSAEHTGIHAHSADAVTAAQAFHWFDPEAFRMECRRILKPGGMVSLVWNNRVEDDPITIECHKICQKYCSSFRGFSGGKERNIENATALFFSKECEVKVFENNLSYGREAFIGRYLSASYAPKPGDDAYLPYIEAFGSLFDRRSKNGLLLIPNVTKSYTGCV